MNTPTIDITANGFNLANAKTCALASASCYSDAPTLKSPVDGTGVIITELADAILIAFEGSKNPRQFITDAEAWKHNIKGCNIHAGFYKVIASVIYLITDQLSLLPPKPIVATGHSLGGAEAQLGAYWLSSIGREIHSVYTFGGPRVGNAAGVKTYGPLAEKTYRVTNGADIVPWCPGLLAGYRHAGSEFWMPSIGGIIGHPAMLAVCLGNAWELYREWRRGNMALLTDHFIDSYIARLNTIP